MNQDRNDLILSLRFKENWFKLTKDDILDNDGELFSYIDSSFGHKSFKEIKDYITKTSDLQHLLFEDTEISQEFLANLTEEITLSNVKTYYLYPVIRTENPLVLLRMGFFPTSQDISKKYFFDYLNNVDIDTIEFWNSGAKDALNSLKDRELRWVYKKLNIWKEEALEDASSTALYILNDSLLYSKSKRPKTSMDIFRTPSSYKINVEDLLNNELNINGEKWHTIPVTRYASGMRRSLYHEDKDNDVEYCGTFYYKEEESTTVLVYKTFHKSFNKYTAFHELYSLLIESNKDLEERMKFVDFNDMTEEEQGYENALSWADEQSQIKFYTEGIVPKDLMLTPREFIKLAKDYQDEVEIWSYSVGEDYQYLPNVKHYAVSKLGLYSAEDPYDQPLCKIGKRLGIDIVILENMVGSFQVVTEVLDTRSREDSLRSLVYVN